MRYVGGNRQGETDDAEGEFVAECERLARECPRCYVIVGEIDGAPDDFVDRLRETGIRIIHAPPYFHGVRVIEDA
jgi:hypothetical protein